MDSVPKTAIVVPCFNEAERLRPEAFIGFPAVDQGVTFIMVDDGSTDGTAQVIAAMHRAEPDRFIEARLPRNMGKAEAVRAGVLLARESPFDYIGYWDADLSTSLDEIAKLRQALESSGKAIALGSRVGLLGRRIRRSGVRHYLGRLFATAASLLLDLPVYDTQCGAKLFRNTDDLGEVFRRPFSVGWIFDVEILARYVSLPGQKMDLEQIALECPLDAWRDVPGSKLKTRHFLVAGYELTKLWLRYRACGLPRRHNRGTGT